ncbi:MAG: hypothetical protein H0W11_10910 [Gemmatimonadetes bacterium]|nr:hypothetical protein [Gemmatimonadota bacterium]
MKATKLLAAALLLTTAACGPRIRPVQPIMDNGAMLPPTGDATVARARAEGEREQARLAEQRDAVAAAAVANCAPAICAAIARGELAVGMDETQVLAATRTTDDAWEARGTGAARVMTPRAGPGRPSDAVGEVAFVNLQNGVVSGYTYREPQGFRTVTSAADATLAGRAAAQAEAMLREGDDYALRGDLARALDRYDRADILRPGNPETTLRIATTLDKSLRPIEAIMRYQLFIHQLELERIHARGEAAAKIAEAIARAHERIIVLERR